MKIGWFQFEPTEAEGTLTMGAKLLTGMKQTPGHFILLASGSFLLATRLVFLTFRACRNTQKGWNLACYPII